MSRGNKFTVKAEAFHPIKENVFVSELDSGPHITAGGIIRPDDNMSESGIRPRWGKVFAIGPDVKGITVGEWVFIEHARWTNSIDLELPSGIVRIWKVDWPAAVLLACPEDPREGRITLPEVNHPQSKEDHIRSVAPAILRTR